MTDLSYIIEDLRGLAVPVDSLNLDPKNARKHGDSDVAELARVMKAIGQDQAVVVQKTGMIVRKGNGRLLAARQLGWTHIAAVIVDDNDATAVYRAITDNRTAERSSWDSDNLIDAFDFLADNGMDVATLDVGFDDQFVTQLFAGQATLLRTDDLVVPADEDTASGLTPSSVDTAKQEASTVAAVHRANIVFDTAEEYATWISFTRELKTHYPSLATTGQRVIQFIRDQEQ